MTWDYLIFTILTFSSNLFESAQISFNGWQKSFTLESLIKSDDDDDGNENGKKSKRFD